MVLRTRANSNWKFAHKNGLSKTLRTFENYWNRIYLEELYDFKGWKPVYTNKLPPQHTLLREERIPYVGDYGKVDEHNKIVARIEAERFVLMLMPYLPLNRRGMYDVLAIDIDCNFDLQLLIDAGIPMPRYFVSRLKQGGDADTFFRRPHLVYWLRRPVMRNPYGRAAKPEKFFLSIKENLETKLKALGLDVDTKTIDLSKNPHSDVWEAYEGEYRDWSLHELAEAVGPLTESEESAKEERLDQRLAANTIPYSHPLTETDESALNGCAGRNEFIFSQTRLFAYPLKKLCADESELHDRIERFAHDLNRDHFASYSEGPMGDPEVDRIVRSVVKFVIEKYSGPADNKDRGACGREGLIQAGMQLRQKQGIGGKFGGWKNANKTRIKVLEALKDLECTVTSPSVSQVARDARVSRTTARKWMKILAAERAAITPTQVDNTVSIRKGLIKNSSVWRWDGAGVRREFEVTALPQSKIGGMFVSSIGEHLAETANSQIKPPPPSRATSIEAKYSHPNNRGLALTIYGDEVEAPFTENGKRDLPLAPTRVLDLGGFLDDSVDEYSPPIGEIDHHGNVRYPEEIYAPSRIGIKTNEWTEEDVDRYFEKISAAG